ncbi:MAG TPA: MBL fold metallo-hydrolase [Dehalococcoidia bacterium]|nr:MBL fold metallo-hydrolase [Dehalococcoidia bacterium]
MTHPHAATDDPGLPPRRVEEVHGGVFAFVQPDGSWGLNNTGFIVGRDAVLAIDACFTERRTRALIDAVRDRAGPRPVRMLVNTHHHGDHTFGNHLFLPDATIIGHERCRRAILREGLAAHALFPGVEWGEIVLAPPSVTFTDRLELWLDDMKVELISVAPAHTTNDIVAWLPEQRLLFAGDAVFHGGTPFALAGSVEGWIEALARLRALDAETIVPGHGAICGASVLDDMEEYLRLVQRAGERGVRDGIAPLEMARQLDVGRFGAWLDGERLAANLHRAYSEARGEPRGAPLPAQAIEDMIAFNGGRPPRCLA